MPFSRDALSRSSILLTLFCLFLITSRSLAAEEQVLIEEKEKEEPVSASQEVSSPIPSTQIRITAKAGAPSLLEYGQATSVLEKNDLTRKSEVSLGETLRNEVGVSSSYTGPGTSRPVIRGNAGERVRILRSGVGNLDVSNTAEDHQVSINPLSAESIEVLRGPETLLYGSSAIGGVVNVVDGSIPSKEVGSPLEGEYTLRTQTANDELTGALKLKGQVGSIQWTYSGLIQDSSSVDIPGFARSERYRAQQPTSDDSRLVRGKLPNSQTETVSNTFGLSHVWEDGYIGASMTGYLSQYGVPGDIDPVLDDKDSIRPQYIDVEQWRLDTRGEFRNISNSIDKVRFSTAVSNYDHKEVDGHDTVGRFANDAMEARVEVVHAPIYGFSGTVGSQVEYSEFSALGDSVFVPGSKRAVPGVFVFEEIPIDADEEFKFLVGARVEMAHISPDDGYRSRTFVPLSVSSGFSWDINGRSDYTAGISFAYTERAPAATELYADGVHFGRRIAELGDDSLSNEQSLGVDFSLKKNTGVLTGGLSLYAQEYGNYINLASSGRVIEDHNEFAYTETRARFQGFEVETELHFDRLLGIYSHEFSLGAKVDYVHARDLRDNRFLPRIPPLKTIISANYGWRDLINSSIEGVFVAAQRNIGAGELPTDAYQMLNANLDFTFPYLKEKNSMLFARAINLTNEDARVHSSFVKEFVPLPGRSFILGLRGTF